MSTRMKSQMSEQERAIWNSVYAQAFSVTFDDLRLSENSDALPDDLALACAQNAKASADLAVLYLRRLRALDDTVDAGLNVDHDTALSQILLEVKT
jgi:hypothetical protein